MKNLTTTIKRNSYKRRSFTATRLKPGLYKISERENLYISVRPYFGELIAEFKNFKHVVGVFKINGTVTEKNLEIYSFSL